MPLAMGVLHRYRTSRILAVLADLPAIGSTASRRLMMPPFCDAGGLMGMGETIAAPSTDKECAPCKALSDLLKGMPGMRDHTARKQHSAGAAEASAGQAADSSHQDCMTCRVTGTLVSSACSAYLAGHLYLVRPVSRGHRISLAAGSALFAGLAVLRAIN